MSLGATFLNGTLQGGTKNWVHERERRTQVDDVSGHERVDPGHRLIGGDLRELRDPRQLRIRTKYGDRLRESCPPLDGLARDGLGLATEQK